MAGDLRIHEQVIILEAGSREAVDLAAVEQASGGVTHQYGERVIIAAIPPDASALVQQQSPYATLASEATAISEAVRDELDQIETLGLEAFSLRQSPEYKAAKAQRPLADEPWDSGMALAPDAFHEEDDAVGAGMAEAAALTSSRLTGKVAVGLIIVEGPTNSLKFSAAERTKVVAEVQNGLSWLGSQSSPAGVSWVYDIQVITLNVRPGPESDTSGQKEARWRDPAMAQLGFGTGLAGVQTYIEKLRSTKGTDWAYCGFFTKYPVGHFAYASIGGPRLVMHYNNDGWGPDNIDRVFAHETGHIFNAPDEYAASGCNCGGQWGVFNMPNSNCENCATNGVACIMKSNSWEMCDYTPYHLGFPQGQHYSGVFESGIGTYGLWVNADWQHFVSKWQEWSGQGLRLEDIEISQPGGQLRYSGVFREGSGGYALWALADWNSFVSKWQELSGQGLRLVDLEVTPVGGQLRYSGVFREGSGGYALWALADWNSFVSKWQELSGQGLRLVDLEVTPVGGQLRYSGVFRQGSGGYALWALADWNSFVSKWQELSGQGLRLVDLEVTPVGGQLRYSGVFRQGSGGYALWANSDWSSFVSKWQELSGQGLRLVDFDINLTGVESAASPTTQKALGAVDEEVGTAGYGFLSTGSATTSSAGMGAVFLPVTTSGDGANGAGMGAVSLSGTPSSNGANGAGMGAVSLPVTTSGDGANDAGNGTVSLSGTPSSKATSGAGIGEVVLGA